MARLPPLSALRAFESAARHRSFTKAAKELCVTQSAVSRHVRALEEHLGVALFIRNHKAIALTPEGQVYMHDLVAAFSRMDLATRRVRRRSRKDILNIHAYATVAMRWLIPRLGRFQEVNPDVDIRLTASVRPVDFAREEIHCAIRSGPPAWDDDIPFDRLFGSTIVPVCAPNYLTSPWPLREPSDLGRVTLLHSLARNNDWAEWLSAFNVQDVNPDSGMKFESSIMTYLAAEQGLGVAIAEAFLVMSDLREGRLVMPFPQQISSNRAYYFLSSPSFVGWSVLESFRSWLLEEACRSRRTAEDEQERVFADLAYTLGGPGSQASAHATSRFARQRGQRRMAAHHVSLGSGLGFADPE